MTRINRLGGLFHHPDEFRTGAQFTMRYLDDMYAWQEYLDGRLELLYARQSVEPTPEQSAVGKSSPADDATGYALYRLTGPKGIFQIDFFQTVSRYTTASVFANDPAPVGVDNRMQEEWDTRRRRLVRECRRAVEWYVAKGRGVLVLERQVGGLVFRAVDPAGYIPIVHPRHRDQVIGHALFELWRDGPRLPEMDVANRIDITIYVDEASVEMSDGFIRAPVMETRSFGWQGRSVGVLGTQHETKPARLEGLWTFGTDWSTYGSMERLVFEALLAKSNSRTSLTRDIRPDRIVPQAIDDRNLDAAGRFSVDRLNPDIFVPVDEMTSGTGFGYVDPPGPTLSDAWNEIYEQALMNLAEAADIPRVAFGEGYQSGEPDAAVRRLNQSFVTKVVDIRDDLTPILTEAFEALTGVAGIKIGWADEPFVDQALIDDRVIKLKGAGLISTRTGQEMARLPIDENTITDDNTDYADDDDEPMEQEGVNGRADDRRDDATDGRE